MRARLLDNVGFANLTPASQPPVATSMRRMDFLTWPVLVIVVVAVVAIVLARSRR